VERGGRVLRAAGPLHPASTPHTSSSERRTSSGEHAQGSV